MTEKKTAQGGLTTKLLLAVIAALLVVIVILMVLLLRRPAAPTQAEVVPGPVEQTTEPTQHVQALEEDDPGMQQATEETGVALVTKYMRFAYPEDLKDVLIVTEEETEARFCATFSMIAAEQEVELFAIILSETEEEGYKLGYLEDETYGTVIITTRINEQSPNDWPEEEFARINSMQERINDILVQFYEDPRFIPAH